MNQLIAEPILLEERQGTPPRLPEGLTMRPAALADVEAAVELTNICAIAMSGRAEVRVEDVRLVWQTPGLNLEESLRAVFTGDGRMVGCVEVWDLGEPPVNIWVWGRVLPDFEGLGIGTHLMTWAEQRARRAIERAPADARVVMHANALTTYEPARRLLRGLHMAVVRHHWQMEVELYQRPPGPQWPQARSGQPLKICTFADFGDARAVYNAVHDAFADHWGYVEPTDEAAFERWRHFAIDYGENDLSLWFLALDGEEIAGMSLCQPESKEDPEVGWVSTLGVLRPWRRKGLGLALLQHSFGEFYWRGKKRVGLGVDAESLTGATRLYERAGMHVVKEFELYEKELRPGRNLSTQEL